MPVYEYLCKACNKISEYIVDRFENNEQCVCKHCASTDTQRRISSANINTSKQDKVSSCDTCACDCVHKRG